MNQFKKSLLIALTLFLSIECSQGQQRRLKTKPLSRQQQNHVKQEVKKNLNTDDQKKIAQEVKTVNAQTQTPQEKQDVKVGSQKINAIKNEIEVTIGLYRQSEDWNNVFEDLLKKVDAKDADAYRARIKVLQETKEIKKELAQATEQDQPHYITYDEALDIIQSKKELAKVKRSSWTDSLIIKPLVAQAYNNVMLLFVALREAAATNKAEHNMFKKDNFYTIMTHAFEGGAILAVDLMSSTKIWGIFYSINDLIIKDFDILSKNPAIVQSIWSMTQVMKEVQELIKKFNEGKESYDKKGIPPYDTLVIEQLCRKAAEINKQVLHDNKKTYTQYAKDWISQPKNLAKAGLVMAAIGGLYIYGPAIPAWLKEYANSSISSMKASLAKGYQSTISSVKNLWNKVRGNQELPDSTESRMDTQEQESSTDEYFAKKGRRDAEWVEDHKEQGQKKQRIFDEKQAFEDQQQAGQMLNDFDDEMRNDEAAEREKIIEQARQEQQQEFDYPAQETQEDRLENAQLARERASQEERTAELGE